MYWLLAPKSCIVYTSGGNISQNICAFCFYQELDVSPFIARTPHAAVRIIIRSATAYEPAVGFYKAKEDVRYLRTTDFTEIPDRLDLRTARACSREENTQEKEAWGLDNIYGSSVIFQCAVSAGEEHAVLGTAPSSNIHSSDPVTLSVPNVRSGKELFRPFREYICRNGGRITLWNTQLYSGSCFLFFSKCEEVLEERLPLSRQARNGNPLRRIRWIKRPR